MYVGTNLRNSYYNNKKKKIIKSYYENSVKT